MFANNAAVTAGDIMALTGTRREKMFLSDNDVQLQKKNAMTKLQGYFPSVS